MKRWTLWVPLVIFLAVVALAAWRLTATGEAVVKSALVGKPLPEFSLPAMVDGKPGLSRGDLARGKPRLLNVFASWCVPCIAEAPQLLKLKAAGVEIDAIWKTTNGGRDWRRIDTGLVHQDVHGIGIAYAPRQRLLCTTAGGLRASQRVLKTSRAEL